MFSRALLTALAVAGLCVADNVVLERNPSIPDGWEKLDKKIDPGHDLQLTFAMRQPDIESLTSHMSTCMKAGRHLTRQEALALRNPDQADIDEVLKWLKDNGLDAKATSDKDWIHVDCSVEDAEALLDAQFDYWQFESKKPVLRTKEYSVPESVADAISFIHPIANFMPARKDLTSPCDHEQEHQRDLSKRYPACAFGVTPECLRELYNINYKTPNGTSPVRLGVAGFLEEYANYQDIGIFMRNRAPEIAETGYNFTVETLNGGSNSQKLSESGPEAALDMEYTLPLAYPAQITYYLAGGRGPQYDEKVFAQKNGKLHSDKESTNEPYLEFLDYLLSKSNDEIPHVLSISYADSELTIPKKYAQRVCDMFGLLTARGTTILAGSGDGGSKGSRNSTCRTLDGTNKDVTMGTFPASCPWVTAVGAVTNWGDVPSGAPFSSGGFSQYFKRPQWQNSAVDGYVKALNGHLKGYYNPNMRAIPDISAVGTNYQVLYKGRYGSLMGTSASTPVIASMLALINDERLRKGKPVLGWINKLLYSDEVKAVLQDTTVGQSYSCKFKDGSEPGGWRAATGYDCMTGVGVTNDFEKLREVLVAADVF